MNLPLQSIAEAVETAAARWPDRGFVFQDLKGAETRYTFSDIERGTAARAAVLSRLGLARGDRLGLGHSVEPEDFVLTFLASSASAWWRCRCIRRRSLATSRRSACGRPRSRRGGGGRRRGVGERPAGAGPAVERSAAASVPCIPVDALRGGGDAITFRPSRPRTSRSCSSRRAPPANRAASWCRTAYHRPPRHRPRPGRGPGDRRRRHVAAPLPRHGPGRLRPRRRCVSGIQVVFIPTLRFLRHPFVWMETMHRHRATISFAPNFAYALATPAGHAGAPAPMGPLVREGARLRRRADQSRRDPNFTRVSRTCRSSGRRALPGVRTRREHAHRDDDAGRARAGDPAGRRHPIPGPTASPAHPPATIVPWSTFRRRGRPRCTYHDCGRRGRAAGRPARRGSGGEGPVGHGRLLQESGRDRGRLPRRRRAHRRSWLPRSRGIFTSRGESRILSSTTDATSIRRRSSGLPRG